MNDASASSTPLACPGDDEILAFRMAQMPKERMDSIESHLAHCDRCLSVLESFDESSDTIVQTLSTVPGVAEDEPEFRRIQQALLADPEPITDALTKTVPLIEPTHVMQRSLPQRLGNYELTALIGRGATGAVYESRHVKLGRRVAIKVLSARHAPSGSEVVQRFFQEIKGIGKLDHPNIIRATDAGDEDGRHFLVMEYAEGIDLSRLLRIIGRLRVADACELARQTAEALGFAHQHSLVHRDVKPSNILLTTAGQIKLLDLGLVAFLDESTRLGTLDNDLPHGTADYMPPEQWTDFAKVDARADFYSLGCTLFRLLTGHAPYAHYAPEYSSKMEAHQSAPIPQIRKLRPEVPLGVQKLLTRLLAKHPSDRFESANEIIAQLEQHARGSRLQALVSSISARETTHSATASPESVKPRLGRRKLLIAAGAVLPLCAAPWLFRGRQPRLEKRVWRPLTPTAQTDTRWPHASGNFEYRASDRRVIAQSTGDLLIHLGQPVTGKYAIRSQIDIREPGSAGLFFNYRPRKTRDGRVHPFQAIEIIRDDSHRFRIVWSHFKLFTLDDEGLRREHHAWAEISVEAKPMNHRHALQVTLGEAGFPRVSWHDSVLSQSRWKLTWEARHMSQLTRDELPHAYLARLGLLVSSTSASFYHTQLMYL